MLSWQLASLMMAHSPKMTITFGGSIVCCGELTLESIFEAPLLFCLSLRLTTNFPSSILSVPIFLLARIRPSSIFDLVRAAAGEFRVLSTSEALNGGSRTLHTPAFDRRQIVDDNATFGVGQQKAHCLHFLILYGDWSTSQLILACSRPNRPMETVSWDPANPPRHAQTPSTVAHMPTTGALEMSNLSLACIIWRQLLTGSGPPAARIRHGAAWCDGLGDQKNVRSGGSHGELNNVCGVGHDSLHCKSHIGPHQAIVFGYIW
ncbi:hypothetical protein N7463_002845 [Penicillium fimorum]|uniref:Uncharacterized protein n=1 Tax=Penicillium fimorum TaxID=1882269 RepID=A0A9W9XZX2_9EURO|nr:hypothetical protein N7463_002845 [Penicillium fimorum]